MLIIHEVSKTYAYTPILDIPSLHLEKGIYWLQGINGAGKTTLLRMIAGLSPFKGDILIDGISLHKSPLAYRRQVSWADAEPLYPHFITGEEMLAFYCSIRKASTTQVDHLTGFFGIRSYLAQPIGSYSNGMVKRLSLLLAFVGAPSLILLDEPLATLDADAAHTFPHLVREYRRDRGTSFIFSSHQPIAADMLTVNKKLIIADRTIQSE